ncbi:MAG TPA: glycosyltransferase, partial [Bacteroidales bacterium]|nr:glycosyltransferase [Bacteroidales bacterium]
MSGKMVSVCMISYNHEFFIREAIEGVLMQQTDFHFELVIGEDLSTDRTREICIDYKHKYPDKIR